VLRLEALANNNAVNMSENAGFLLLTVLGNSKKKQNPEKKFQFLYYSLIRESVSFHYLVSCIFMGEDGMASSIRWRYCY
jgi:hypothetical protein